MEEFGHDRRARQCLETDAGDLHAERLLDRHRQPDAAADPALCEAAQRAGGRPLRLRPDLLPRRLQARYFLARGSLTVLRYIFWRIAIMIPTLLIISALVFTIIELPPGDYFESYAAELRAQGEGVDM